MNYGKFSDDGKEFIIERVDTPSPWINYLYNKNYFSTISNNGGGLSYFKNPLHGRITRYRINDVPHDRPGKYIYVKDADTKDIWSLTWQPVGANKEAYKVIHGFGYTKVISEVNGIYSELKYFVPKEDNQEIWCANLKNNSDTKRKLILTGYVELALGHALIDVINQCDDQHFNRVIFDKNDNSLYATKTYWVTENSGTQQQENQEWDQWAFFTCNLPVKNYETLRERFIGPFRNENNPLAVETDQMSGKDTDFGNAVGALQTEIELAPGESKKIVFSLGVIEKENFEVEKKGRVIKYHDIETVEKEFNRVTDSWQEYMDKVSINTPDNDSNVFINYWTKYQAKVAYDVGRVASFYYWGISRGFGFRDTAQDSIAIMISEPEKVRERIFLLARHMFSDGRAYHHFFKDGQGELTKHCDDPLWFILVVADYIKETGDFKILNETEKFADGQVGTILEHLQAILMFVRDRLGKHNLPLFGRGDWNDTLDYIGGDEGGESVWGGMFYVTMLNSLIELYSNSGNQNLVENIEELRNTISEAIYKHCWDGEWFIRAFGEQDKKIGSSENEFGKIFLNTQSWAAIADIAPHEMLIKALDSVEENLNTEYGPKICAPAYTEIDKNVGLITRCVAGKKENGAIFCHPVTWLIQAECKMKRGNKAFEYYKNLLPNRVDSDTFKVEPFVYSQYITSNEHYTAGQASHSWQTGTAAWMFRIFLDCIMGIRNFYNGLIIDPVIPSEWNEFKMIREFRGTKYFINVSNPSNVESGIKKLTIDGITIDGNLLPLSKNKECIVNVIMG